jgi:4-alpha-glucanotransferase
MKRRGSGILLHITSLPSPFGIGDMGPGAYRFVDFLAKGGQSYWQILPINPTDPACYNSPYHSVSAYAGNPLLISPEILAQEGLIEERDIDKVKNFSDTEVDYESIITFKEEILAIAYERFKSIKSNYDYERFCIKNSYWLEDYATFKAFKREFNENCWTEWPREFRDRIPEALQNISEEIKERIDRERFIQFCFYKQFTSLKNYCHQKGIHIIGDLPIYVIHDSCDTWKDPDIFKLDGDKRPYVVAGVPPDYFSKTGQLWGNPIYRWDILKERGYEFWKKRIAHNLKLFDFIRIDHFRGFVAYWEVPASETTAINGRWVKAPAMDFFNTIVKKFPCLPIIAEDLGIITPDVREVMEHFGFPGMRVLLFAFGDDFPKNPYIPHNLIKNCVAYTGTHDNNTVKGWIENEASEDEKQRLFRYIGREVRSEEIHWELIRLLMISIANTVIFPMQDILGLGEEARMNRPSTREGNWKWRLVEDQLNHDLIRRLFEITEISGRT